ncbi:DNase I-like protein [Hygrophoropsis aurantiaca]|uniref:DNase I-like protein n=1 Tax=Hygrophoropsis aurantiaca TaxID=72124 RepID=A0ACB8AU89_9AGAM|nr:DNase I-like protein [Hygrophoropsis aurantiaca]
MASETVDLRVARQPLHSRLSPASAGLPGDDIADIEIIREDWIRKEALKRSTTKATKSLNIRIGSFNVNGKTPSQDLSPWLRSLSIHTHSKTGAQMTEWISPLKPVSPFNISTNPIDDKYTLQHEQPLLPITSSCSPSDPDLLVLGFQELDLSTEALLYTTNTLKEDSWVAAVFAGLGEKAVLYEKLASKQLVGMLMVIIVKKSLFPNFDHIMFCSAGAGIMGFMGNKGATAIRVSFTPSTDDSADAKTPHCTVLTFVNAHLAAFEEMVERRNNDFQELSKRLVFEAPTPMGANSDTSNESSSIYKSDALFWFVNLNYRLDLSDVDTRNLLALHSDEPPILWTLLKYDQLKQAIHFRKAFADFHEHDITHLPSYRFASGALKDDLGYDKKRKPAWTDRILYMHSPSPSIGVHQLSYVSHPEITMSDHRPISSDFKIQLPVIDQDDYLRNADKLSHELWGFEDVEARGSPRIKLKSNSIEFGKIFYQQSCQTTLEVDNIGDTPCVIRFVPADIGGSICPDWLRIEPPATLLPAHMSIAITLTAFVSTACARLLNQGPRRIECMLILHTALGKDHFVVVGGEYQHTCFANSLATLTRLTGPVRTSYATLKERKEEQSASVPREAMRLINWLMEHVSGEDIDCLFNRPADENTVARIRECLDTGDELPSPQDNQHLPHGFARTLLQFLDTLAEPIVPPTLYSRCLAATDRNEAFELLDDFPSESVNIWVSLTAFLHYVVQSSPSSASHSPSRRAEILAAIFAPILLGDPKNVDLQSYGISPVGKANFLLKFIQ